MYDRFLSMFNSQECMILLSVILFGIYFMNRNNIKANDSVTKMIFLTILVMSCNINKEMTIMLCIVYIFLTFNKTKNNIENFNVVNGENLVTSIDHEWNKLGIQAENTKDSNNENTFIKKNQRLELIGRPQQTDSNGAETVSEIKGIKDTICASYDPLINIGILESPPPTNNNNRCNGIGMPQNLSSNNLTTLLAENEDDLMKISKCAISLKEKEDGKYIYEDDAFAPCAAAYGKFIERTCKFTAETTSNAGTTTKCYKQPYTADNASNSGTILNGNEDNVIAKLKSGELPSNIDLVNLKKYTLNNNTNEEINTGEEFTSYNLNDIKNNYLTESTSRTGPRVDSNEPYTTITDYASSGTVPTGHYLYKTNPKIMGSDTETNNFGLDTWENREISENKFIGNSNILKHKLNNGYIYIYEYEGTDSNSPSTSHPSGKLTFFEEQFHYRRVKVLVKNQINTNQDNFFLGYLGNNFINDVNTLIGKTDVSNVPFFNISNSQADLETDLFHPIIEGINMFQIISEVRENIYLKYNPFNDQLVPGTDEHLEYTKQYNSNKNEWENKTSKYIMRSIGCNRLKNPKEHKYGWWGKETIDDNDVWKCMYEPKTV